MDEEETEYDRFLRFSRAIANNIPSEDGEELGDLFIEKHGDDTFNLALDILQWLSHLGFSEEDAISVFKCSLNESARLIFNTSKEKKEILA